MPPMTGQAASPRRRGGADFQVLGFCLVSLGIFAVYPLDYLCVVIPAVLPLYLWVRAGTPGMPTLPIIAGLSIIYYAVPLLRGDLPTDDPAAIFQAAIAVAGFLLSAALFYQPFLLAVARRPERGPSSANVSIAALTFAGLAAGIVFYLALFENFLDWLGPFIGVARAVGLTFASIGCYLAGAGRARGELPGVLGALALLGVTAIVLFSMNGLLLVGGVINILAAVLGYVVSARRIPWVTLLLVFALISVFQAGKAEMRDKYWDADRQIPVSAIPATTIEWFQDGVDSLWSGSGSSIDVLERASLLWIVMRIQAATPDYVPYLNGETYALLPSIVLPRFIEPDKVKSQAGLDLLSVRYGFQSAEDTDRTTIGFGLVAEGYANFGTIGVLAVGALFGALCGVITWFSAGASPVSLRMFIAIAATTVLLNVEADLSYLLVTILQAVGGVLIAAVPPMLGSALLRSQPGAPIATARGPAVR